MDLFVYLIATVPNVCWVGIGQVSAGYTCDQRKLHYLWRIYYHSEVILWFLCLSA